MSSQGYDISSGTNNLLQRRYQNFAAGNDNNEGFEYDDFDRLVKTTFQDPNNNNNVVTKHNYTYKPSGNLDHKDDCGDYVYGNSAQPYQLTGIQNPQGNISLNTLNITHNDLGKVNQISEAGSNKQFDFVYGNDAQRIKMEYRLNSQLQYTRYYQDGFDRQENANGSYQEWSYVYAPTGLAAVYHNNNGTAQLYNVSTDHLGSPLLLTAQNGQPVEEYSFDAWGRRRNPADWSYNNVPAPTKLIRGYTGHEHLDEVGLINMNGRVYDPVLGRFIQPDPVVQNPGNLQNLNRYSYVLNNPLKYTDPSGYIYKAPPGVVMNGHDHTKTRNPSKPVVYVDDIRIEPGGGGYDMYMSGGGGVGVASKEYYGVWTGNGPGINGTTYSYGVYHPV